jgi:hypothetical protein
LEQNCFTDRQGAHKPYPGRFTDPDTTLFYAGLPVRANLAIAITAINRFITTGLEGDFGALTTFGTGGWEHLARGSKAAIPVALRLPCLSALRASLGFVGVAFGLEEFLVLSREGKAGSTIGTLQGFILKTHGMTSSLLY